MPQDNLKLTGRAALLASIAACFPVVAHGAPVARVDFAIGNVAAVSPNGQSRQVTKGASIDEGEMIATNNGRAQLRFTDGAYVSLQPQSEFRIDKYKYQGQQDGSEKGFFSLLKGGLRTITGLIGRSNKQNYQVNTTVATIGIRGTEYTIQYGSSITGTVGEGEIEVCNGAGCLNVTNGESYYVQNQDVKPQLSNKGTDLPPAPPENPPSNFAEGENTDESGRLCSLGGACGGSIMNGIVDPANVAVIQAASSKQVRLDTTASLSGGVLTDFLASPFAFTPTATLQSPGSSGNDGVIAWGTALGATGGECCFFGEFQANDPLHYVVGVPVNVGTLADLQGTYTLLGATLPTGTSTGTVGGRLNSMTMTAFFPSGNVAGDMNWTLEGNPLSATFSGFTDGPTSASGSTSSFSGSVSLEGFFAGANAARAGFVYEVSDFSLSQNYIGAATLQQTSLVTPVRSLVNSADVAVIP